jgi:hypothetical protein
MGDQLQGRPGTPDIPRGGYKQRMRPVLAAAAVLTALLASDARAATVSSLSVNSDARDFM